MKLCETAGAGEYSELPGWLAWMVQVPAARSDATDPETVQTAGVEDAKATASPEVADADKFRVVPATWPAGAVAKVMVWLA